MNTNYFKESQAGLKYTEGVVAGVSAAKTEDCQIFGEWITIICGNRRRMRFLNLDDGEYNPSIQFGWNYSVHLETQFWGTLLPPVSPC